MKKSILSTPIDFDKSDFLSLLSLSAGYSIATQIKMGELVIGGSGWNVDIKNGTIKFGEKVVSSGVLGSESEQSDTWLWSWANTESGLPEIASAPSRRAKKLLSQCEEFSNPKFMLDELHSGHNLSVVCCGVNEDNLCYYRCHYNGGAVFVTVKNLPEEVFAPLPVQEFLKQYLDILSTLYCDHKLLCAGFLHQSGYRFEVRESTIYADVGGYAVKFDFENIGELERLVNIS